MYAIRSYYVTEEDLLATSKTAFTLGWRIIKLYFMMGLPTETDEDLAALVDLAARVKATGRGSQGGADVNVSVSNFVPKAHTPFQWEAQLGREEIRQRQDFLREALKNVITSYSIHYTKLYDFFSNIKDSKIIYSLIIFILKYTVYSL